MGRYDKFNSIFDAKTLANEVKEIEINGDDANVEVPKGKYEVKVEKLYFGESKTHKPMVTAWFRILAGSYNNNLIFMNKLVDVGFKIHQVDELLRGFDTGISVGFDGNFDNYANMIDDVFKAINDKGLEYALEYGENSKGFKTYSIKEVFETK